MKTLAPLLLLVVSACSHTPSQPASTANSCNMDALRKVTWQSLENGFYYTETRLAPASELKGRWKLLGQYSRDLDQFEQNYFEADGLSYGTYSSVVFESDPRLRGLRATLTTATVNATPETYDVPLVGEYAQSILYGAPNDRKIEQSVVMLKQCDGLLIQWHYGGNRTKYFLFAR